MLDPDAHTLVTNTLAQHSQGWQNLSSVWDPGEPPFYLDSRALGQVAILPIERHRPRSVASGGPHGRAAQRHLQPLPKAAAAPVVLQGRVGVAPARQAMWRLCLIILVILLQDDKPSSMPFKL